MKNSVFLLKLSVYKANIYAVVLNSSLSNSLSARLHLSDTWSPRFIPFFKEKEPFCFDMTHCHRDDSIAIDSFSKKWFFRPVTKYLISRA